MTGSTAAFTAGEVTGARAAHLEHEVAGVALAREVAAEHVERALRLAPGQRERLEQRAARGLREHVHADEHDHPGDQHPPAVAVTGA